jgi:predicted RND superfamily exporter protein
MGPIQRKLVHGVMTVVAWPRTTLIVCAVLAIVSIVGAKIFLSISTDENKLFDRDVKFFKDYLEFASEFPENESILVVVRPADEAQRPATKEWIALADEITAGLRAMPQYVKAVDSHVPVEKLGRQGLIFDDSLKHFKEQAGSAGDFAQLVQLVAGRQGLAETIALGRSPVERLLNGNALVKPDGQQIAFMQLLADSWGTAMRDVNAPLTLGHGIPDLAELEPDRSPRDFGYHYIADEADRRALKPNPRHLLLINVYEKQDTTSLKAASESIDSMRAAVATIAAKYPQFKVDFTGRPVLSADELKVSDWDNTWAECWALPLIFVGLALMLRSLWLALVAEITLGVGIAWTFGWATTSIGQLNLLSLVFVIALIGIGMDYLIQILSRYRHEARRYTRPAAIWARVFRYTSPPISTACLGAAGAFFVARFTHFQGAAELGVIAGGGLLLCLLAGYTVLPAILVLLPGTHKAVEPEDRYHVGEPAAGGWRLILPVAWVCMLVAGIPLAMKTDFDPELLKLQPQDLPAVKLVHSLPTWSAVLTSKDLEALRPVRDRLKGLPLVESTDSLLEVVDKQRWLAQDKQVAKLRAIEWTKPAVPEPSDLVGWARAADGLAIAWGNAKVAEDLKVPMGHLVETLKSVAALWKAGSKGAAVARRMDQWQEEFIAELRGNVEQFTTGPLDIAAVPAELRSHYVSEDGTYALYINPKDDLWDNEKLKAFVAEIEKNTPATAGVSAPTGIAIQFFHSTEAIRGAFFQSTIYALVLIILLVYLDLRDIGRTLMAISVLALGLPVLLELMVVFGIKWNFANFFGLPILIGAGHEYGVFMIHRYKEVLHDPRRVWHAWDVSDKALLLCAFVTCTSFGFLGFGRHLGIASLGKVMALGVACIYLATILVLRPLLVWRLKRRKVYGHLE